MLGGLFFVFPLAFVVLMLASWWMIFQKAGQPAWACIVPIYGAVIMCRVGGKSGWWVLLLCIPLVNIIFAIMLCHAISKNFGHDVGMTLLLIFLPFIGLPMLGFGSSQYSPV